MRVLVIEDDPDYAELVKRFLSATIEEKNISIFYTLREAILSDGKFCVILADLMLPDGNGIDVITRLRERWPHVPIVAMTGMMGQDKMQEILMAGAQDFLLKDEVTNSRKHLGRILGRAIARSEILSRTMNSGIQELKKTIDKLNSLCEMENLYHTN